MSLLDKQEVQDISEHTTLHARKWSDLYVNECQKIRSYRARSTEERRRRRKKKKDTKSLFFTSRGAYVNCTIIAVIHSFDLKSAIDN